MKNLTDQLGNSHFFESVPKRIISLVPSQTETLFDLDLENSLVGITKFCVHPFHLKKAKTIVGGTKTVNFDKIKALYPDIIVCNKEENTKEMVQTLSQICPVWVTDIISIESNTKMILDFGKLFNVEKLSKSIVDVIDIKMLKINILPINTKLKNVACIIWKNPWMAVGHTTYINEMLKINGFQSSFDNLDLFESRYPEFDFESLKNLNLDYIFLSSEPYPFKQIDVEEIQNLTGIKTFLVDGEMFSWHGSRLGKALDYFNDLATKIRQ